MFTGDRIQQWYKGCRDVFGRLKRQYIDQRSGSAPQELKGHRKWVWDNWQFLWDVIKTKNEGKETQVGICNQHLTDSWCGMQGLLLSVWVNPTTLKKKG